MLQLTEYRSNTGLLYGDLHVVGTTAIIVYPVNQAMTRRVGLKIHGWLEMHQLRDEDDLIPGAEGLQRDFEPMGFFALPARRITIKPAAMHPVDLGNFKLAGGQAVAEGSPLDAL